MLLGAARLGGGFSRAVGAWNLTHARDSGYATFLCVSILFIPVCQPCTCCCKVNRCSSLHISADAIGRVAKVIQETCGSVSTNHDTMMGFEVRWGAGGMAGSNTVIVPEGRA
jgi:hypothetical protein